MDPNRQRRVRAPTRGGEKVKKHITKRRWGLPGGHFEKKYRAPIQGLLDFAINELGDAALANKESVEREIGRIVDFHRTLRELERDPPRPTDVAQNLKCVRDSASELRAQIAALDYLSLKELRRHGAFEHPSLVVPIDKTKRPGNEFIAIGERKESRLLSMLDAIVEASERALAELPEKDPGGSKKHPMLEDSADDELVDCCYSLFDEYRPGVASTTEGQIFRTFVSIVYELSADCEKDLERSVKKRFSRMKQNHRAG